MPKLKSVLLVGKLDGENVNTKAILLETKRYEVDLKSVTEDAIESAKTGAYDLGVFSITALSSTFIRALNSLRGLGCKFPILVIVKNVRSDDFSDLSKVRAVNVLQQPFKEKDLIWHADTMTDGNVVQQRAHPRFYVKYDARFEIAKENLLMTVSLFNYSMGGACVIANAGPDMEPGDLVRLTIDFIGNSGTRTFDATVVWTEKVKDSPKKSYIGIQFSETQKDRES